MPRMVGVNLLKDHIQPYEQGKNFTWTYLASYDFMSLGRRTSVLALKNAFPSLFRIAKDQEGAEADSLIFLNNIPQWNVSFIREVHDWEPSVVSVFLEGCMVKGGYFAVETC